MSKMDKVRKVLVHLSKDNAAPQCARFVQSITGHFTGSHDDQVVVNCVLENNRFILYDRDNKTEVVPLRRASFCPFKHLSDAEAAAIPPDVHGRGVDVGVAILLQSANQRVLLTRRTTSLRIFPNVWVPPGGHVELDEGLVDAGLRELREETGLRLDPAEVSTQLLGLWESVYPPMLSRGLPQRHHVVTYMLLCSSLTHQQLQVSLRPDPAEVSGCLWADAGLVRAIVAAVDGEQEQGTPDPPPVLPETVSVTEVSPDGMLTESQLPVTVLCNRAPAQGADVERVSTGTKFALELWARRVQTPRGAEARGGRRCSEDGRV